MLTTSTASINTSEATASICQTLWVRSFTPMNKSKMQTPVCKKRNLSATAASRKNIALNPRMAKMLEKNTTYGSSDTENTAGILSNAKIRSLNSITNTVTNNGVMHNKPFFSRFDWVLYLFGAFLVYSAAKMFFKRDKEENIDVEKHPLVRFLSKHFRVYPSSSSKVITSVK